MRWQDDNNWGKDLKKRRTTFPVGGENKENHKTLRDLGTPNEI
jgi:hypothetical protein